MVSAVSAPRAYKRSSEISRTSVCHVVSAWRVHKFVRIKKVSCRGWQSHVSIRRFFFSPRLRLTIIILSLIVPKCEKERHSSLTSTFTRSEALTRPDPRRTSLRLLKINTRRRRASHYKTRRRNPERALSAGTFRPGDYRRRWYRVKGVFALTAFSTGRSHRAEGRRTSARGFEGGREKNTVSARTPHL